MPSTPARASFLAVTCLTASLPLGAQATDLNGNPRMFLYGTLAVCE